MMGADLSGFDEFDLFMLNEQIWPLRVDATHEAFLAAFADRPKYALMLERGLITGPHPDPEEGWSQYHRAEQPPVDG